MCPSPWRCDPSLAVTTSKDSSIGAESSVGADGFFSSLVYTLTYVDASAALVTLGPEPDPRLAPFLGSNGLQGIVVELVRPSPVA